jgi:hypothetical protein
MATASSSPSTPQPFKVRPHRFQSDNNPFPLPLLVLTAGGFVASQLILGSSSVARKHILEEMGLEFQVMVGRRVTSWLCRSGSAGEVLMRFVLSLCGFRLRTSTRRASGGRILTTW